MQHIAILKKQWNLLELILNGKKTIESRWYKTKRAPFNKIKPKDIVYFKNSGELITAKAEAYKVLQFENLNKKKIKEILKNYGQRIGIENVPTQNFKDKNYCILIFLKNPKKIKPFHISKKGYGLMSAWMVLDKES